MAVHGMMGFEAKSRLPDPIRFDGGISSPGIGHPQHEGKGKRRIATAASLCWTIRAARETLYAGLELLLDGTFVSATCCTLEKGEELVVASVRFKIGEIDKEPISQPAPDQLELRECGAEKDPRLVRRDG